MKKIILLIMCTTSVIIAYNNQSSDLHNQITPEKEIPAENLQKELDAQHQNKNKKGSFSIASKIWLYISQH